MIGRILFGIFYNGIFQIKGAFSQFENIIRVNSCNSCNSWTKRPKASFESYLYLTLISMHPVFRSLKNFSFHGLLLILFFLADGYKENIGLIPLGDLALYFLILATIAGLLFFFFNLYFRSKKKAGILVTLFLLFFLFYGVLQDFLQTRKSLYFISGNRVLLPVVLGILILAFIFLSRSKRNLSTLTLYINCLLLIYLLIDVIAIAISPYSNKNNEPNNNFVNSSGATSAQLHRPDIFFILLDEYSGDRLLKEHFKFDNRPFRNFLLERNFFVAANPASNYSYTPFSMAATFDMDYPKWIGKKSEIEAKDYTIAAKQISDSRALQFLRQFGYQVRNYSVFDIQDQQSIFDPGFLALKIKLISHKTMLERIRKAIFWGADNWTGLNAKERISKGNQKLIELTREASSEISSQPRFIYTHLMMPHPPYLFDSTGKEIPSGPQKQTGKITGNDYLQYLVYTNKVVGKLIDEILLASKGKAVIILLSDHGSREIGKDDCEMLNSNFSGVYLPGHNYRFYYDSISNVNQFPALFNSLFQSKIPLLKDSCIF
jgi:Sulfatase